ncbi:hypothetical protein Bca52824_006310 [Brassica carinata]|uniref:KIB1-4 beta-propeller domain-containing protein n=1 Tax=Brassica carinata TaxID=52824 RepID=A0A8X7WTK9_BRACI|nr:hypothetical protein Bca52824_006310 [Brassica carinata]
MSLFLREPSKLCFRKQGVVRSSPPHSEAISFPSSQTPPCFILRANYSGEGLGQLRYFLAPDLEKKAPMDLVCNDGEMVKVGSSHGWVATRKRDGTLRLQDDLNPAASDTDPKRIQLPPLVTLPHCQTELVANVSMSSPSPEDEDCIVAVKFFGPQLSYCRPGCQSEWTNVRIASPCFYSSRVMFSKKDDMFHIPASSGHIIGSWDLRKDQSKPKLRKLWFQKIPKMTKTKRDLLDSCCTTEYLVESTSTGETFLVKHYKKASGILDEAVNMKTKAVMVFRLDGKGNAVYTQDIGDLCIFISESEPFCVPRSSFPFFPCMSPNAVTVLSDREFTFMNLADGCILSEVVTVSCPFYIPPQDKKEKYKFRI